MNPILLALIVFLAVFTQSLTGFGSALVAMALLPALIGMRVATPLVAALAMTIEGILLLRYKDSLNLRAVWRLSAASLVGIPLGMIVLGRVDESLAMGILGWVIVSYAAYSFFELKPPELSRPVWAYTFGLLAGMLGGAYNTSGPPAVIYANARRWSQDEFKSNLQGFFLLNDVLILGGHVLSGNFTAQVFQNYLIALPAVGLGILAGVSLDRRINPQAFRKVVLGLLLVTGARLVISSF
jgi:hypothetical protein